MKYYIDFEASEADRRIISVGAISEDGRKFYSLVHTDDPITDRIYELTGISQEDVDHAPSSDQVFSDLYDWCQLDDRLPDFINYGDGDLDFVYDNFKVATSFKEACMLSYLYLNMYDCSGELKDFFGVNKTISLEKLGRYFDRDMEEQDHNALNDAILLKMVLENMEKSERDPDAFREYFDQRKSPGQIRKILRIRNDQIVEEYPSMKEALEWVKSQPDDMGVKYIQNAEEKIRYAAKNGSRYFKYNWRIL